MNTVEVIIGSIGIATSILVPMIVFLLKKSVDQAEEKAKGEKFTIGVKCRIEEGTLKYSCMHFADFFPESFRSQQSVYSSIRDYEVSDKYYNFGKQVLYIRNGWCFYEIPINPIEWIKDGEYQIKISAFKAISPIKYYKEIEKKDKLSIFIILKIIKTQLIYLFYGSLIYLVATSSMTILEEPELKAPEQQSQEQGRQIEDQIY
jgi:hypothetical protein